LGEFQVVWIIRWISGTDYAPQTRNELAVITRSVAFWANNRHFRVDYASWGLKTGDLAENA
jgi:hypothetical protein